MRACLRRGPVDDQARQAQAADLLDLLRADQGFHAVEAVVEIDPSGLGVHPVVAEGRLDGGLLADRGQGRDVEDGVRQLIRRQRRALRRIVDDVLEGAVAVDELARLGHDDVELERGETTSLIASALRKSSV